MFSRELATEIKMDPLTQDRLKELLHYDPATGVFTWRVSKKGVSAETEAGHTSKNYTIIGIDYRLYMAHRLAWLYIYGVFPNMIDHKDMDKKNNRISNLRICDKSLNGANSKISATNTSGFKGVSWHNKNNGWRADIKVNGKRKYLGLFSSPKSAHEAYIKASKDRFGEFARIE